MPLILEFLRQLLTPIILSVIGDVLHKREIDPEFRKKMDEIVVRAKAANTQQERLNVSKELQNMLRS